MADTDEKYIREHKSDVEDWALTLFAEHAKKLLMGEASQGIPIYHVSRNRGRDNRCYDSLKHLGYIKGYGLPVEKTEHVRGYTYPRLISYSTLAVDPDAFEKYGPKYAKQDAFEYKAPDKKVDRSYGYKTLENVCKEGVLHIYFNKDKYEVLDRIEAVDTAYHHKQTYEHRVIRVFPKSLESNAEQEMYRKQLNNFCKKHIAETVQYSFGFVPEVLDWKHYVETSTGDKKDLRKVDVHMFGQLELELISPETVQEHLKGAQDMLEYAQACVRDLERLGEALKAKGLDDKSAVQAYFEEKCTEHLQQYAPLYINDEDESKRVIAHLALKGSHKGLI